MGDIWKSQCSQASVNEILCRCLNVHKIPSKSSIDDYKCTKSKSEESDKLSARLAEVDLRNHTVIVFNTCF